MAVTSYGMTKNPFSSLQAGYGSWSRRVPLLPSGPDGVPRQPIAYDLEINAEGVTERVGFEPTVPLRVHTPSKRAPSTTRSSLLETTDGLKAFANMDVQANAQGPSTTPR